jgi:dihydroorotase-like cyclic amidohydrolase
MPNLNPAPDSPEHLEAELALIRRDAVVRVYHAVVVECAPCPAQDSFDVFHFDLF